MSIIDIIIFVCNPYLWNTNLRRFSLYIVSISGWWKSVRIISPHFIKMTYIFYYYTNYLINRLSCDLLCYSHSNTFLLINIFSKKCKFDSVNRKFRTSGPNNIVLHTLPERVEAVPVSFAYNKISVIVWSNNLKRIKYETNRKVFHHKCLRNRAT